MLKQNQRSEIFQKPRNFHLNKPLLMGVIVCLLSISLMTSASAKELRIKLTESLDVSSNDKKPKDLAQKAKSEKKEVKKLEKPKPAVKVKSSDIKKKPASTVKKPAVKAKLSLANSTKTKQDTVKNSIGNVK
jgi:hypothetical protein